jgi:Putative transposase/Transposase zinc-binding domain
LDGSLRHSSENSAIRGSLGAMADLGEIARAVGDEYLRTRRVTPFQREALRDIRACRSETMGSVRAICDNCGSEHLVFRSCQNRSCPRCQAAASEAWLAAREKEVLPVPYFHVVFTVPAELNVIALYCPELFYAELLRAAGRTLLDVGRAKLHARLGCMTVLHTWGQNLALHPHAHCVVPGGGFSEDRKRWVGVRKSSYLLPTTVLASRFRTLFCRALRAAERGGQLKRVPDETPPLEAIRKASRREWVVYAKPPFSGPEQVLEYVSRYTHRIAISNNRILSFADNQVTFTWRDYADGNRKKVMVLDALEFLRRFLQHVLPDRFVRIRYFGFMANGRRRENIELARALIGLTVALRARSCRERRVLCPACRAAVAARCTRSRSYADRSPPVADAA